MKVYLVEVDDTDVRDSDYPVLRQVGVYSTLGAAKAAAPAGRWFPEPEEQDGHRYWFDADTLDGRCFVTEFEVQS